MKAEKTKDFLINIGYLICGWESPLKDGKLALAKMKESTEELEELERLATLGSYIEKLYKANGNKEYLEKLKEWANKE